MENQGQNVHQSVETKKDASDVTSLVLFNRNSHFAYVYRKTEKLVTAVYMITNFVKDSEPLKWKIRENALSLMALNISFNTVSLAERRDLIKEYQALSLEIVSLSGIAFHSGLISEMNYRILSREFTSLLSTIEKDENKRASEETVMLDPGFFEVASQKAVDPKAAQSLSSTAIAQAPASAHAPVLYTDRPVAPKGHAEIASPKSEYLPIKDIKEKPQKSVDSKDSRQSIIIKMLSKRGGLNVNDFVEGIKGVSVKTIQRELLAMVASGVLKKEGERRWSTYSLNR